ncbi:Non-heme 11 kDa protein of cytochrome bc1 complex [Mycena latifolia]|nr:Non-heme 11 kDa protein of cytochrome bc1 complex [Mycena latifolia]
MSGISSFLSSFFPIIHADAAEEKPADTQLPEDAAAEESKEEEPEDEHPAIRAACEERADCAPLKHRFEKCQAKLQAGEGLKGEDCVEEIIVHCSEACAAPQLFAKLR